MERVLGRAVGFRHCQLLGLTGSTALAAGGVSAGALPVREMLAPGSGRAALGLVGAYFGLVVLIAAWALVGRAVRGACPPGRHELLMTLVLWAAPLVVAPPLFSRDVYSYLAQGAMVDARLDVYVHGPSHLGGPLTAEVAPLWRDTPAPYGPVFLALASAVAHSPDLTSFSPDQVATGVLGMRLVALLGVASMALCLPRLALHCGTDPSVALWLGALNPLVLLHLVSGAHNDAIMLGLLGVGLVAALGRRPVPAVALITLAALVKAPAALGLVAVVVLWARQARSAPRPSRAAAVPQGRQTPLIRLLRAAALLRRGQSRPARSARAATAFAVLGVLCVCAATTAVTTAVVGTGYGWLAALDTPVSPENWSLTSTLGRLTTALLSSAGDPLTAAAHLATPAWHLLGLAATALAVLLAWRRHHLLRPVHALGLSLTAVALLGPAIRPWYPLWGLFLIAAAGPGRSLRRTVAAASGLLALAVLPSGFAPDTTQLALAVSGGLLAVAALWATHRFAHRPVGSTA
ncbi:polyprenol phosphomannose-dependent alpha 1,6 mannosyltransferase MptB [Streptomyces peucetius]|uniref:Polyprenol phosphomannose-dependent alpha 1,6 mannosyltransferase MptB n=1 Tax=Streptomyces peucetius TaxID=1950 RepID=A0ABY6ILL7_STRPE|nr:polyprenol phosphomannose-dependent alpha 1,6 mannosyltransferase MptB [Streptomyces peucetius]UYQ66595.1 polyprenol phosphomannose-dependent alpha 1,6 mannosyltransferase MptB [Streptomyces peucetius]